ncbi:MAG: universal stress protein [Alphaproteobacteria bacterium]
MTYQETTVISRATGHASVPIRQKEQMGLRDILVQVDDRKPCPVRVQAAIGLAVAHRAHLIGLYVITDPHIPSSIKAQISADVLAARAEAARERAARAETMFREQAERAGVASEWLCEDGDRIGILIEQARFCDVAVIGQHDPDARELSGPVDAPDHVVLSAGRPVLVVPRVGTYPSVGKRVMVAWDGSLPAARAVNDALPILRRAEKVNVITVYRHDVSADAGRETGERICRHLARHGIAARSQRFRANGIGTGDLILSRAADDGVDLIVMGAYGHARWRELVLGGVTLHMLKHMTVPVLMSH